MQNDACFKVSIAKIDCAASIYKQIKCLVHVSSSYVKLNKKFISHESIPFLRPAYRVHFKSGWTFLDFIEFGILRENYSAGTTKTLRIGIKMNVFAPISYYYQN